MAWYAESWSTERVLPADQPPQPSAVDAACATVGRGPATLERTVATHIDLPGVERRPCGGTRRRTTGSPEALAAFLCGLGEAGITHVQVGRAPTTPAGIEAFAPTRARFTRG